MQVTRFSFFALPVVSFACLVAVDERELVGEPPGGPVREVAERLPAGRGGEWCVHGGSFVAGVGPA
jgi:hypothetical protein